MKVPIMELMEPSDHQKKRSVLILLKQTQHFIQVFIIMLIIVIVVNGKEIFKLKADNENINFPKLTF